MMKLKAMILLIILAPNFLQAQIGIYMGGANDHADLIIGIGGNVTVGTASSSGVIVNSSNDANLIINSGSNGDGSLISGGTPHATVERYITVGGWHNVTPITDNVTPRNTFYLGAPNRSWLVFFTESDEQYHYVVDIDSTLIRGVGYAYYIKSDLNPQTVQFKGQLTGSDLTVNLKDSKNGWNLVGNPFPCALNWASSAIDHTTNITGTAYVWSDDDGGYLYSTTGSGTHNGTVGTLPNDIIPLGQGFFVQATSNNVNFVIPAAARVHDHTHHFLKDAKITTEDSTAKKAPYIRIDIDGGHYGNTVFVGFPQNGTKDFDLGADATKLFSSTSKIQFYAGENDRKLCVNANPPLQQTDSATVPLYVVQATGKSYIMKFSMLDHIPSNVSISLEDLKEAKTQDIRQNPIYKFKAFKDDDSKRFLLHFNTSVTGIKDPKQTVKEIQIYSYGQTVFVHLPNKYSQENGKVLIYDLLGRKILEKNISGSGLIRIPLNISSHYVIVKVTKSGHISTKKVYIQ